MAKKQKPTTSHRRRTREELVIEAFRYMIRNGEAKRTLVSVPLVTGGTMNKVIYKVEPNRR